MIKKVAFFAHPTQDMDAAARFYGEALGFESAVRHGDSWAEFRAPDGTTIALDPHSPRQMPGAAPYLALETDDIAAEVARLKGAGVEFLQDPWTNKDEAGKEVCKMAILRGPDGHVAMLHEIAPDRA